ncbi:hypothetical protein Dda_7682 [Drechslerella dactyloides]|uniref:DUF7704 domain-containing protein n=1 Tax=Drechslerella dactyloides TaxID=74499 RepID=A0AAD6IWY5_DREDA|nr:hypothetical protein Dda_7682 [Drechslerella dactyloides]
MGQYGFIYRLVFLYIEPLLALSGSYLTHFAPQNYISRVVPSAANDPITTATQLAMSNLAAMYVHFAIMEAILLRVTNDRKVWHIVLAGTVVSDVLHLWIIYHARGAVEWDFGKQGDWEVFATSYVPLGLRLAFLAGFDGWTE